MADPDHGLRPVQFALRCPHAFEPTLGGDHAEAGERRSPDAPALGGLRGHPPWLVAQVRELLAEQGLRTAADCQGRKFTVVKALLQAEIGLADEPLQALIDHLLGTP